MNGKNFIQVLILVLLPALATYLLRVLPLLLLRRKLKNPYLVALFKYMPFALLSAMIVPGVFFSTVPINTPIENRYLISAAFGFLVALVLSLKGKSLSVVAIFSCIAVFLVERLFSVF